MGKNDSLSDRMKRYEDTSRIFLLRRMYTIIRIDGKAFHTYTKELKKPFDHDLIYDLDETAKFLCRNIQGCKLAYMQSDEISLVLTDFDELNTSAWFDNNIQKIVSVSASMATSKFNQMRVLRNKEFLNKLAFFDARAFQVPTKTEVINYLIWRQNDAIRNSVLSVAQSFYSHEELQGKNINQMLNMISKIGLNWDNLPSGLKRGRLIYKRQENKRSFWDLLSVTPSLKEDKELVNKILPNNF